MNTHIYHDNEHSKRDSLISRHNSGSLALSAGSSFNGTFDGVESYSSVSVLVVIDTTCTLEMISSIDGLNNFTRSVIIDSSSSIPVHTMSLTSKLFRININADQSTDVNGSVQVIYSKHRDHGIVSLLSDSLNDNMDCEVRKSVIVGKNGDNYVNIQTSADGDLSTNPKNSVSGFDHYNTQETLTPKLLFSNNHVGGIVADTQKYRFVNLPGGSIEGFGGNKNITRFYLDGTPFSQAARITKKLFEYQTGISYRLRTLVQFGTVNPEHLQVLTIGNDTGAILLGYFLGIEGIFAFTNGVAHVVEIEVTVASTGGTADITLDDTVYNITLSNAGGDTDFTAYEIAQGGTTGVSYVGWGVEVIESKVYFSSERIYLPTGVFSYVSANSTGVLTIVNNGVDSDVNIIPTVLFNGDSDTVSNWNAQDWNEYELVWGGETFKWSIFDASVGKYKLLHYANWNDLSTGKWAQNAYYLTGITDFVGSGSAVPGEMYQLGSTIDLLGALGHITRHTESVVVNKTINATVETNLFVFTNRLVINNVKALRNVFFSTMYATADGNRPVIIRVILNPDLVGDGTTSDYPLFQSIGNNLHLLVDTNSTSHTGGTVIAQFIVAKNGGFNFDLSDTLNTFISFEDTLLITAESTASNVFDLSIIFSE